MIAEHIFRAYIVILTTCWAFRPLKGLMMVENVNIQKDLRSSLLFNTVRATDTTYVSND